MSKTNRSGQSDCLTKSQLEKFYSNIPEKYSLLAEVLYFSAGRATEISTLKVRNINFDRSLITIEKSSTKTRETRQVPMHPQTLSKLKRWISGHSLGSEDYIFFSSSRNTSYKEGEKPVSIQCLDQYFRKTFDRIGIKGASTHSFRRSRLTHLMQQNWNLRELMDISGHKNLMSLQKYLDSDRSKTFEKYNQLMSKESFV